MSNERYLRASHVGFFVCIAAAMALTVGAIAQEAPPAASQPAAGNDPVGFKMARPGVFEQMHFHGADLRLVLQMLSTQGKKNIVATRDVTGSVTADLYDVTFKEALDAIIRSNGFVYEEKGNIIHVMTAKQQEEMHKNERPLVTRSFRLAYTTAKDAKQLIAGALSKDGGCSINATPDAAAGIAESKTEAGGNTYSADDVLVVCDYEENLKKVEQLIREIDVKPEQVLIEATILSAKLT